MHAIMHQMMTACFVHILNQRDPTKLHQLSKAGYISCPTQ